MVKSIMSSLCTSNVQFNDETVKMMYDYVSKFVRFKYKSALDTLKSRHHGYEEEDFIQEVMQKIMQAFETKVFPSIGQLKNYAKCIIEFHYLKEKRKYFYTKSRGTYIQISMEEELADNLTLGDLLTDSKNDIDTYIMFDFKHILEKNLFLWYDWHTCRVGTFEELKRAKTGSLFSVNRFIVAQSSLGMRGTCRYYKENGFYMTQSTFDTLSQAIIDYAHSLELIQEEQELHYVPKVTNIQDMHRTCECGYVCEDTEDATYWQCPICGKIHDKRAQLEYLLGLTPSYSPINAKSNGYLTNIDIKKQLKTMRSMKELEEHRELVEV